MSQTKIKRLVPGIMALATAATLGIPQEAQAGIVTAESEVLFRDVALFLTVPGNAPIDLIPGFLQITTEANATLIPGGSIIDPPDPPVTCPAISTAFAEWVELPSFSEGGATIDCQGGSGETIASNFARTELRRGINESGNALGGYQAFIDDLIANPGNIISLDTIFNASLAVSIANWDPGDFKQASAEYLAQFVINEIIRNPITGQDSSVPIFIAPVLTNGITIQNENGEETFATGDVPINIDFTIPTQLPNSLGIYDIRFSAVERTNAVSRQAPEPSTLVGILAMVGVGALSSRRKSH